MKNPNTPPTLPMPIEMPLVIEMQGKFVVLDENWKRWIDQVTNTLNDIIDMKAGRNQQVEQLANLIMAAEKYKHLL